MGSKETQAGVGVMYSCSDDTHEHGEAIPALTVASVRLRESIESMRLATEEINKKLGDAYPNGLVAEIEDIKRRLSLLESRWQWQEDCGLLIHPWSERPDG
jgi:hypothetical protein